MIAAASALGLVQHDVEARLDGGIHHTFVQPDAGPPQWLAPDGSAVSGKLAAKDANGAGNIAELNLDATQIGNSTGRLAHVVEVLRLNTVGGLAPAYCRRERLGTMRSLAAARFTSRVAANWSGNTPDGLRLLRTGLTAGDNTLGRWR